MSGPLLVGLGLIIVGLQALIIAVFYGGREAERAEQPARRPAAPDLSTTLAARIAQADQIAATGATDLDAVDQHFATAAALLTPDSIDADTAALIRQAEAHLRHAAGDLSEIPIIPGDQS